MVTVLNGFRDDVVAEAGSGIKVDNIAGGFAESDKIRVSADTASFGVSSIITSLGLGLLDGIGIGDVTIFLADSGVLTQHLADLAVTMDRIDNGAVTGGKIAPLTIVPGNIGPKSVTTSISRKESGF